MDRRILIVDDEKNIRTTLGRAIGLEGFVVESAGTAQEAWQACETFQPELVLLDLRLPDQSGLDVLERLRGLPQPPAVVMMSGHGTLASAVRATQLGAVDFLEKPIAIERVILTIRNALRLDELDRACALMQHSIVRRHGMVGSSAAMHDVLSSIQRAAPSKARMISPGAVVAPSLRLTVLPSLKISWNQSFSATNAGHLPVRTSAI